MIDVVETEENFYTRNFLANPDYKIGPHTYGRPKVYDWNQGAKLIIGDYTSIADDVVILLGGNHRADWISMYPFPAFTKDWPAAKGTDYSVTRGDIVIGNDVWIGHGAMIMSGVTIGNGAIIGARAVVLKDVPPYAVVGGIPAKVIKLRFSEKHIAMLQELGWWDWTPERINQNLDLLSSNKIDEIWLSSGHEPIPSSSKAFVKKKGVALARRLHLPLPKRRHNSVSSPEKVDRS